MKKATSIREFIDFIKSCIKREYREVPVKSIIAFTSALVYLIAPMDAIPDVLMVLGLTDDIAVIAFCLNAFKSDFEKYKEWKGNQLSDENKTQEQ